jgi:O-antigen/teichoic acid export membrane protein
MTSESQRPTTFWATVGRPGSVYLAAEAIGKGGTYLLFIALAAFMTVEDFGLLNVFVSLVTLLGVAMGLGLPDGVVRFNFRDVRFASVLTLALGVPLGLGLVLTLFAWISRDALAGALNVPGWLAVAATAGAGPIAIRQVWLGVLRARTETGRYLLYRVIELLALCLVLGWVLVRTGTIAHGAAIAAYLVALGTVALWAFVAAAFRFGVRLSRGVVSPLLRYSTPLVAHSLAMTGIALFDQIVIQQLRGAADAGVYAFAYRIGMAMTLLIVAFTNVWGPLVLERMHARQGASLASVATSTFRWMLGAAIVLAWVLPLAAREIGGPDYAPAVPLVPVVIYGYLWMVPYSFFGSILAFRDRSLTLAAASGATFLLNAILNYVFVPTWGVWAAALTTLVSYAFLASVAFAVAGQDRALIPWLRYALLITVLRPCACTLRTTPVVRSDPGFRDGSASGDRACVLRLCRLNVARGASRGRADQDPPTAGEGVARIKSSADPESNPGSTMRRSWSFSKSAPGGSSI